MTVVVPWLRNHVIEKYGEDWNTIISFDPNQRYWLEKLPLTNFSVKPLSTSKLNGDWIINPYTGNKIEKYENTWWNIILLAKDKGEMIERLEATPMVSYQTPIISRVGNIKNIPVTRAGVILYTVVDGDIYIGLGADAKYNELTDFGGGVRSNQNSFTEALRELCEESVGLYCNINKSDIINAPIMYDKHNLIIFLYVRDDPLLITERFRLLKKDKSNLEINDIDWMILNDFMYAIQNNSKLIYVVLRNFLVKNLGFYNYL